MRMFEFGEYMEEEGLKWKTIVTDLIKEWLEITPFPVFAKAIKESVIGQEALEEVLFAIYVYLEKISRGEPSLEPILIAAPSGCGKTETFRAVRDYFKKELSILPCYQADVSAITETGFRGAHVNSILTELFNHNETNGVGIVWLDEFDKKILPSYGGDGTNVNRNVQHEFLTILEGREVTGKKGERMEVTIDTSNTFFIAMGAFDYFRNEKANEANEIGFGADYKEYDHYDYITREDIIEAGGCYELLGRISSIINFHPLSDKDTRKIIDLIRRKEESGLNLSIEIKENSIKELVALNNSKFGCRLIRSAMHDRVMMQYKNMKLKRLNPETYKIVLDRNGDYAEAM